MTTPETCIFCKIVRGEAAARIVYRDERVTAFYDTHPLAPVHILIVPNQHIDSVSATEGEDEALLGHLMTTAKDLARRVEIHESGFRLMMNTGPDAGQTVRHLHLHLLGGRRLPMRFEPVE